MNNLLNKCAAKCKNLFYLAFRLVVGLMFATHGAQKFGIIGQGTTSGFASAMGLPVWIASIAASIELAGGLMIALGLFTRLSALLTGTVMLGALAFAHFPRGINPVSNGGELALVYLAAFLALFIFGSGRYSLERLIFKNKEQGADNFNNQEIS